MASTVSAWAKPGAWALDSEENEADLREQLREGAANNEDAADFPSLAVAAATKTKKKKKPQTISIQEFNTYHAVKQSEFQSKGLTPDELISLPTGPRERSAEELDRNKLGGGFRFYGGGIRDEQTRRHGSFNRDSNREFAPSRADETDSWAAGKKQSFINGFERRGQGDRGGFPRYSDSQADEVDNWAANKSFVPSDPRRNEKREGFGFVSRNGNADSDSWVRRKEEGRREGGRFDGIRVRSVGIASDGADSQSWFSKKEEVTTSSRTRLNLQSPLAEGEKSEIAKVVKPKANNPFGDARPREDVLKDKGQDWRKIDEKLDSMKLKEVSSLESTDAPTTFGKKKIWSLNSRVEDKTEKAWRRPGSVDSRPHSSAGGSENEYAANMEKGDA